jgi:putative transcriptional regulator
MIKNKLSTIMGEKRIKMSELTRISGLTYETVFRLYHNKTKGIDFETLSKICYALECDIGDIFSYIPD